MFGILKTGTLKFGHKDNMRLRNTLKYCRKMRKTLSFVLLISKLVSTRFLCSFAERSDKTAPKIETGIRSLTCLMRTSGPPDIEAVSNPLSVGSNSEGGFEMDKIEDESSKNIQNDADLLCIL